MEHPSDIAQAWLQEFLGACGAQAGTVHRRDGDELVLVAAIHIPPPVLAAVARVPHGKGMAGLAFSRDAPVTTCNLATDDTGDVRPGARAVDAKAAAALPVHDSASGAVRAVVGLAFPDERELEDAALSEWQRDAEQLPELAPA